MSSLFIVDLHVVVNNIKPLNVAMEKQEWITFALLSSYKIFRTYKRSYVKVKVEFTLKPAMKAQRGSRGRALLFL
jgi:hypothetical protein